jgi:hypothetical protein
MDLLSDVACSKPAHGPRGRADVLPFGPFLPSPRGAAREQAGGDGDGDGGGGEAWPVGARPLSGGHVLRRPRSSILLTRTVRARVVSVPIYIIIILSRFMHSDGVIVASEDKNLEKHLEFVAGLGGIWRRGRRRACRIR